MAALSKVRQEANTHIGAYENYYDDGIIEKQNINLPLILWILAWRNGGVRILKAHKRWSSAEKAVTYKVFFKMLRE